MARELELNKMISNQIFSSLQGMGATVEADMVNFLINIPCDLYL